MYKHEYMTSYILNLLIENKGEQIRLSGFTVCDTKIFEAYIEKKYIKQNENPEHESVFLEIHLDKQQFRPMGISQNKLLGEQPDINGNQKWIMPNGSLFEIEDFF